MKTLRDLQGCVLCWVDPDSSGTGIIMQFDDGSTVRLWDRASDGVYVEIDGQLTTVAPEGEAS